VSPLRAVNRLKVAVAGVGIDCAHETALPQSRELCSVRLSRGRTQPTLTSTAESSGNLTGDSHSTTGKRPRGKS
jgi:hypothetical protein